MRRGHNAGIYGSKKSMTASSRHLVDPELLELADASSTVIISEGNLLGLREAWCVPPPAIYDIPDTAVKVSFHSVKSLNDAPEMEVGVYRPAEQLNRLGCIFFLHGGGYIGGHPGVLEQRYRALSTELHCVVMWVNYRLAPETRFSGNIEDCYAALWWLFHNAPGLGVDPHNIGVMGESAGGGLAAALALLARDRGQFKLAFQHLIYPMLDDRTCVSDDPHPFTGEYCWSPQNNHFAWSALLGKSPGADDISPYAAPARAKALENLPPTFICTAALDLFLEENIDYARRLTRAGVPVELHVYPGAFHGFDIHPTARVARAARRDSLAALAHALGTS